MKSFYKPFERLDLKHQSQTCESVFVEISNQKSKNVDLAYLNINSLKNKMEGLNSVVGDKHDILCIAESKLNPSFPKSQLVRTGYKPPYRLDISSTSGGLIVYVRNGISSRFLQGIVHGLFVFALHYPQGIFR